MEFLDVKRLGKQRVEAGQILEILLDIPILPKNLITLAPFRRNWGPWHNHPAVLMWKSHEEWLKSYLDCCIGEWEFRGYVNNITVPKYNVSKQSPPKWLGFEPFHASHRSNLLRKSSVHYRQFWPYEAVDLPYFWPTKEGF
jgi:hypothetical protein